MTNDELDVGKFVKESAIEQAQDMKSNLLVYDNHLSALNDQKHQIRSTQKHHSLGMYLRQSQPEIPREIATACG